MGRPVLKAQGYWLILPGVHHCFPWMHFYMLKSKCEGSNFLWLVPLVSPWRGIRACIAASSVSGANANGPAHIMHPIVRDLPQMWLIFPGLCWALANEILKLEDLVEEISGALQVLQLQGRLRTCYEGPQMLNICLFRVPRSYLGSYFTKHRSMASIEVSVHAFEVTRK